MGPLVGKHCEGRLLIAASEHVADAVHDCSHVGDGDDPLVELRAAWYDETDPTHDFATRAEAVIRDRRLLPVNEQVDPDLPLVFVEALNVSPPGWTRETGLPPTLTHALPAQSDLLSLDRVAIARFVLVIADSVFDRDEEDLAYHRGDDFAPDPAFGMSGDPTLDWDGTLITALDTLGLEPVGMPDWLWYRCSWSDE